MTIIIEAIRMASSGSDSDWLDEEISSCGKVNAGRARIRFDVESIDSNVEENVSEPEVVTLEDNSDISDEEDDKYQVVTLSDDDGDEEKRMLNRNPKEKMRCHRCLTKKHGIFRDAKKFLLHIKRHTAHDRFNCPTCHRPFLKINYCISHEIRVHGTEISYDDEDPVIAYAKKYVEEKKTKSKPPETESLEGPRIEDHALDEEDTDWEDEKFYENQEGRMRIVCSNGLMPYRGPRINDWLECYEVQVYHGSKKNSNARKIAKAALRQHRINCEHSTDIFRLGRFSGGKEKPPKILKKLPCDIEREKREKRAKKKLAESERKRKRSSSANNGDNGSEISNKEEKSNITKKTNKKTDYKTLSKVG